MNQKPVPLILVCCLLLFLDVFREICQVHVTLACQRVVHDEGSGETVLK